MGKHANWRLSGSAQLCCCPLNYCSFASFVGFVTKKESYG